LSELTKHSHTQITWGSKLPNKADNFDSSDCWTSDQGNVYEKSARIVL